MAKMFYTLDEAAEKLGKSPDEVRAMATSGHIQEFRDRDKLMFKVEQINLLALDDDANIDEADMSSMIPLADDDLSASDSMGDLSLEPGLELEVDGSGPETPLTESGSASPISGSALALEPSQADPSQRSGVSIFDADELDTSDPAAVTQITEQGFDDLQIDSIGSGSGLLDLTRESDDTSLGAEFLEELIPGDEQTVDTDAPAGGLFETTGGEAANADAAGPVGAMVALEPLDSASSGLTAGLSIGAVLALGVGLVAVIIGLMDAPANNLMSMLADNFPVIVGSLAGVAVVAGILGFVLGKKSA